MVEGVIGLVDNIIHRGIARRATDIHFEPRRDLLQVRIRVDGALVSLDTIRKTLQASSISRIKIMAGIDIAECRIPQDGRADFRHHDSTLQLRISTLPTLFGEKIVIRILDQGRKILQFEELGMSPHEAKTMQQLLQEPQGILLFVGPTGCGKTTTLYACLAELAQGQLNISTIEDPIEYTLPEINQTQVHPKIGLTFAKGLRSLLRQDPDIIVIGEIRDEETAEIAIQAAMTGHLVISTLHCQNVRTAEARLAQLGIPTETLRMASLGFVSQRLLRLFCSKCDGKGCEPCAHTGFYGRTGIFEIKTEVASEYEELLEKGLGWVRKEMTSMSELNRVLGHSTLIRKKAE